MKITKVTKNEEVNIHNIRYVTGWYEHYYTVVQRCMSVFLFVPIQARHVSVSKAVWLKYMGHVCLKHSIMVSHLICKSLDAKL